jgi:hypothetical protein
MFFTLSKVLSPFIEPSACTHDRDPGPCSRGNGAPPALGAHPAGRRGSPRPPARAATHGSLARPSAGIALSGTSAPPQRNRWDRRARGTKRVTASNRCETPLLDDPTSIAALIELGRRYPDAKLVFTGVSSELEKSPSPNRTSSLGIPGDRIIYEAWSRNTRENAVFTRDLVPEEAGEHWILVVQAISLPRALGSFRAVG